MTNNVCVRATVRVSVRDRHGPIRVRVRVRVSVRIRVRVRISIRDRHGPC